MGILHFCILYIYIIGEHRCSPDLGKFHHIRPREIFRDKGRIFSLGSLAPTDGFYERSHLDRPFWLLQEIRPVRNQKMQNH